MLIPLPPISVDSDFDLVESFSGGYDVSILLRNGDTLNVYIDKHGQTHVTMQSFDKVQPELYEY